MFNQPRVLDNVVLFKRRILVPSSLRREVLAGLHSAHQGTTGMKARASSSFYWPGLSRDITNTRDRCRDCNCVAPSQSDESLILTTPPDYPFQKVVADYFALEGFRYFLYADRYSAWISVVKIRPTEGNSKFLKSVLSKLFAVYGVPEEFSSDGGSPFNSHDHATFLRKWGVNIRGSAAYYPQSNGRAELAVKTAKKILLGNCEPNGDIDNDRVARALLTYRNTPLQGIGLSPAQILYGRNLKDCMPSLKEALTVRPEWRIAADEREKALRKRHVKCMETYNEHSTDLPELKEDDYVAVQNQDGNHPKRWDRTGRIIEKLPFRQYKVKMDGSNRVTFRNRKFLRKIDPVCSQPLLPKVRAPNSAMGGASTVETTPEHRDSELARTVPSPQFTSVPPTNDVNLPVVDDLPVAGADTPLPDATLRRGTRSRKPRVMFEALHHGKSHDSKTVTS